MNSIAETAEACQLVKKLIEYERYRSGSRPKALRNLARSVGALPGTIENLDRGRAKNIAGWLRDTLRARLIKELEAELARQYHERAVNMAVGADPRSNAVAANSADIAAILAALGRR